MTLTQPARRSAPELELTLVGTYPTEKQPRGFAITPDGKYLICSGEKSDHISVFDIDPTSGALKLNGRYPVGQDANWVEVVKFFPAGISGGPAAIKALAAPFAGVRFVPTGGVGPGNLGDYLAVPSVVAVGGSWMVPADRVAGRDRAGLVDLISTAVAAAHRARPTARPTT